jgi:hypothetical protein
MNTWEQWRQIQSSLSRGTIVCNWTAAKGFLDDTFVVETIPEHAIVIRAPRATNLQHISRADVETTLRLWCKYCVGSLQRQELRDLTRFPKYIGSILKHGGI